jgi:mRNA interferase RelE/StbE
MGSFEVLFKQSVAKDLRQVPKKDVARILKRIEGLKSDPRPPGAEKLSGRDKYRIRQGVYRILYEIQNEQLIVVVVKVGHRRDVYRIREEGA